jgi:ribonuclease M5
MISIQEVIVVEGKYDKIKLEQLFDTLILTTEGFRLYKDKEKVALLRRLAEKRGLIILTDSDAAGFRIRGYINQCFGNLPVKHAYIPEIPGKERRKCKPGAEGLLGVEGIEDQIIIDAVLSQTQRIPPREEHEQITKGDFFALGLSGGPDSAKKRRLIAKKMHLPEKIPANALCKMVNIFYTKEEFLKLAHAVLGG